MQIVILVGNLGDDPKVTHTTNGTVVANVSLATNKKWTDKNTGEIREKTEWHRLVLFNHTAELAEKYLKKGSQILVQGELQTRKYTDKNEVERYTTEVVVSQMKFLGGNGNGQQGNHQQPSQNNAPAQQQTRNQQSAPQQQPHGDDFPESDDIPF